MAARNETGNDQLPYQVAKRIVSDDVIQIREQRPVGGLQGSEVAVDDKCGKYNLLDEEWIPILWTDGRYGVVDIMEAITRGQIQGTRKSPEPSS